MKKRKINKNNFNYKSNKKAEGFMGMSFSMIFAIILIVFFIIVAFIAIKSFLDVKNCAQLGIFYQDFQDTITGIWDSTSNHQTFPAMLPTSVKYVCFADFSKQITGPNEDIGNDLSIFEGTEDNLFLYPRENECDMPTKKIEHIDLQSVTKDENPYCIPVVKGKINMNINKGFGQNLVKISR
jgi:hypothetical protein